MDSISFGVGVKILPSQPKVMGKALADNRAPKRIDSHDKKQPASIMTSFFEHLEESQPKSRWAVFLLYWFGAVLVAVPTLLTFGQVFKAAWQVIFGG